MYRAACEPETRDADCFADGADPSRSEDSSTCFTVDGFAVFASDDDTHFLEFAGLDMTGTRDGEDDDFAGEQVDVKDLLRHVGRGRVDRPRARRRRCPEARVAGPAHVVVPWDGDTPRLPAARVVRL